MHFPFPCIFDDIYFDILQFIQLSFFFVERQSWIFAAKNVRWYEKQATKILKQIQIQALTEMNFNFLYIFDDILFGI